MLAGYSVLFRSAAALLEELHRQTPEGRRYKLRQYANTGLLCIDEVGYLSFDDKAADLLYEVVTGVTNVSRSSLPRIGPSRNGTRSSPMPPVSSPCSTGCCTTPMSRSLKATAIGFGKAGGEAGAVAEEEVTHAGEPAYMAAVLILYTDLPDTPLRPSPQDQALARRLHEQGVPLELVESALLLATPGSARRRPTPAAHSLPRLLPARNCRTARAALAPRLSGLPPAQIPSGRQCPGE